MRPALPDLLKNADWSVLPMIEPKIDDLLATVDSKYTLVILSAKRAREINSYYNQLGEGRGEFVPPLVESGLRNKPLSIALEEIAEGKIDYERPEEIIEVD
jgi:DNA-directed RNA polymerase subunit omega